MNRKQDDSKGRLMTCEELAEWLRLSPGTIRNWISQDFIPHIKLGRAVRFDPAIIEQWLEQRARNGRLTRRIEFPR